MGGGGAVAWWPMSDAVAESAVERSLKFVQRMTLAGLLAGTLISWPLWTLSRELPPIAWIGPTSRLITPGPPVDWLLYGLWTPLMAWSLVVPRAAVPLLGTLGLGTGLLAQDVARAQPWVFQYMLLLLLAAGYRVGSHRPGHAAAPARVVLRVMVAVLVAVYLYSALSKASVTYVPQAFAELFKPASVWLGLSPGAVRGVGYASIVLEMVVGLALILPRTRKLAAVAGTMMHAGILFCLGPLGRNENAVVWPWNVVMIALLWKLALERVEASAESAAGGRVPMATRVACGFVLILACGLPALGLADRWPAYLSWSMYAGREPQVVIAMTDAAAAAAPADLRRVERLIDSPSVRHSVVLSDWISDQTHARPFPEMWYEQEVARRVMARFASLDGVRVIRLTRPGRWDGKDTLTSVPAVKFLAETTPR